MALIKKTILMTIVVLTNIIVKSDVINMTKDVMDTIPAQHLLRGSNEEVPSPSDLIEEEVPEFTEPDKTTTEYEALKSQNTTEVNQATDTVSPEEYNVNGDDRQERLYEVSTSTTELIEGVSTILDVENEMENGDEDLIKYRSLAEPTEVVDNRNYIEHVASSSERLETTSTPKPQKPEEPVESFRMSDVYDTGKGQRNPKTEQAQQNQPIDKRNDIIKPFLVLADQTQSSTLKSWLEDTWLRSPAALLVPLRPSALSRALSVWNDLTQTDGLNVTDIIVIGFDFNGINWRSRHNLQNGGNKVVSDALTKLLTKYQGVRANEAMGDSTMKALASSTKLVPYDSAIFVVTDKSSSDSKRLPLALRALVEKRLKVYTVWTDAKYDAQDIQLEDLRKVSKLTEGDVLHYSLQTLEMDGLTADGVAEELINWDINLPPRSARFNSQFNNRYEILLVSRGGGDVASHGIPVENGVTSLRVYVEGAVEHAVLYPPNGPQIDLFNTTSVQAFSPESRTDTLSPRDVYLAFPGIAQEDTLSVIPMAKPEEEPIAPTVGLWHLSVRCDTCDYRVTVSAQAKISLDAILSKIDGKDMIHLSVRGPIATVRETTIVDEHGAELGILPFSFEPATSLPIPSIDNRHDGSAGPREADLELPPVKGSRIYVKIVGRDLRGGSFTRLAGPLRQTEPRVSRSAIVVFPENLNDLEEAEEMNQRLSNPGIVPYPYNDSVILSNSRSTSQTTNQRGTLLTAVQIGLSTRLYGAPGDNLQLHFEVTNYRDHAVSFKFEAVGELRFLRGINPSLQIIQSGQTANVIVNVGITRTAQPGARDLITFTAYVTGLEQVSISSYVYVVNPNTVVTDVWSPTLRHTFQGSCIGRTGSDDCSQHAWSATVFARDQLGGLLRLSSSPIGLMYETNFISGTREEVTATYRSTCCTPRMMITAIDAYGNANSYVIDISAYFSDEAIAAIVLGVLLLIAIIAVTIFLIYWCVKRRKDSQQLPYSTSASRTSRRADIG